MWAAIPMLRVRSSGNARSGGFGPALIRVKGRTDCRDTVTTKSGKNYKREKAKNEKDLPAEMSESTVGLRHLVSLVPLTDHHTLIGAGVLNFVSQSYVHRSAPLAASCIHDPAHGKRLLAIKRYLERHLVGCTANPTTLHFDTRLRILDRAIENLDWVNRLTAFVGAVDCCIDNTLGK